jgi:hypothetical protein
VPLKIPASQQNQITALGKQAGFLTDREDKKSIYNIIVKWAIG